MPETKIPTPTEAKPKRPREDILADLEAARAKLRELHPKVEADTAKVRRQQERIEKAQNRWRVERPDEPFDPTEYQPPLLPYKGDADLNREFHKQHYVIKQLDDELKEATK